MGFRWNWRAWTPVILMGVAWVFIIASTSTHTWCVRSLYVDPARENSKFLDITIGLFVHCETNFNTHLPDRPGRQVCGQFTSDPNVCRLDPQPPLSEHKQQETCRMFMSARAFMVLACIASSFTIVVLVAPLLTPTLPAWIHPLGILMICTTFVFNIIGFGTGTHWARYAALDRYELGEREVCGLGAGVALSFMGWFITLVAAGFDIYYKRRLEQLNSQYETHQDQDDHDEPVS